MENKFLQRNKKGK